MTRTTLALSAALVTVGTIWLFGWTGVAFIAGAVVGVAVGGLVALMVVFR